MVAVDLAIPARSDLRRSDLFIQEIHQCACDAGCTGQSCFITIPPPYPTQEQEHERADLNLLVFGNSLSDTGNLFLLSNGTTPNPSLYFQGRLSNGFIW